MADEVGRASKRKPASKKRPASQPVEPESPNRVVQWGGVVTSFIKLGGLAIAGNEALLQESPHDAVVFAIAAFMMAGAQGIDTILGGFLNNRQPPTHRDQ
jgi:hypothetical protein